VSQNKGEILIVSYFQKVYSGKNYVTYQTGTHNNVSKEITCKFLNILLTFTVSRGCQGQRMEALSMELVTGLAP
jgi:hypothetical protein